MATLLSYEVTAPTGLTLSDTFYAVGSVLLMTEAQAKYLLLNGSLKRAYTDVLVPSPDAANPVPPVETNTTLDLTVSGKLRRVTIENLMNLFPRLRPDKGDKGDKGERGERGTDGAKGDPGTGIRAKGAVNTPSELPLVAESGDTYVVLTDGAFWKASDGYLYTDQGFINIGPIRGPIGPQGERGPAGERGPKGDIGPSSIVNRQRFSVADANAAAGQTAFPVGAYTPGSLMAFRNGVYQPSSAFDAADGSTVVLKAGLQANERLEIVAWASLGLVNAAPILHQHTMDDLIGGPISPAKGGTGSTVVPSVYVPATGNVDIDTAAIEAAHEKLSLTGGQIHLTCGLYAVRWIKPRSRIKIMGVGHGTVIQLIGGGEALYDQAAGTHLWGAGLSNCRLAADANSSTASAIRIRAANLCVFENLQFDYFSEGTILDIDGVVATAVDPWSPYATSNIVFNTFRGWRAINCKNGIRIKGALDANAAVPTNGDAPFPAQVVTANYYGDMVFWGIHGTGIDVVRNCDSELFDWITVCLNASGGIHCNIATDPVYTNNNYVNSLRVRLVATLLPNVTSGTIFKANWTFGNDLDLEHDIDLTGKPGIKVFDMPRSVSHRIRGKRLFERLYPLHMSETSLNRWNYVSDGEAAKPVYSFTDEPGAGFYRDAAGPAIANHGHMVTRFVGAAGDTTYLDVITSVTSGGLTLAAKGEFGQSEPLILTGWGVEGGRLNSGNGTNQFAWNAYGVGFNGKGAIVQPALPQALPTDGTATNAQIVAMLNATRKALIDYGLCT